MGIPHFFGHLVRSHPEVLAACPSSRCERLYLDFNCVVHQCVSSVDDGGSDTAVAAAVVSASIEYLDCLVARLQPRRLVYVAVDGVPPRAKMEQQRQRRFMTSWTEPGQTSAHLALARKWDRNAITPGTTFMTMLSAALSEWRRQGDDVLVRQVSDSDSAGEGEQKIFAHLRRVRDTTGVDVDSLDCLVGLDADLCMMSLTLTAEAADRIVLVRDTGEVGSLATPMQFVSVRAMRKALAAEMQAADAIEYVALCLPLGNDFVPSLPGLHIAQGGVDLMVRAVRAVRQLGPAGRLVGEDGHLRVQGVTDLFGEVARHEDAVCRAAECRYYDRVRARRGVASTTAADRDDYPLRHPWPGEGCIRAGDADWRRAYYHLLFDGMCADDEDEVALVCLTYARALDWSLRYVGGDCLDAEWHYPYPYAPTASDMHRFLLASMPRCASFADYHARRARPLLHVPASLHLLAVLPVSNAHLLIPAALAQVHSDPALGCAHMYPYRFGVRTYLRSHLWQCQPALPALDLTRLRAAHDRVLSTD